MKKLLLLLLLSSPLLRAQEYEPLLYYYNEWHFTTCFFGCLTDVYYTNGDTLVGGKNYKVLDGYHFISRTFLLREETQNKKVYLKLMNTAGFPEYLLYDFSMEVGDSIDMRNPITPFPEEAGYYILDSIVPRTLANGNDYNHFYLSPSLSNTVSTTNAVWIEGIGSLSLINAPSGYPDINGVGHLSCAFKNSNLFYSNLDSIDGCDPVIILDSEAFSNPFSEVIVSKSSLEGHFAIRNVEHIPFIDLYDLNGKRIQSLTNNGNPEIQINLSGQAPGIFLLVLTSNTLKKRVFKVIHQ
ncbi:MAG TPA: T9SS type A sorting domain-containing protein [Flavobacteriaceae bacterium]|nr:T9SS type A sorting domain-containing protein [Flavobacteriaceae bacterium]MCB9213746.1 T9SS type A sorting domain-containing protein [Alteromonas sp.]HPF12548.1 T9SS type A sorting domain-containing protein [Flavobacteriaceae bacterium]HQU22567.1 T9SS type A sorting domain-containing protein [Flavobacteriaceae bacterium]HQU66345.1 T9SS type A sorting domain-containing protein [Flavobacteriaceae bacterium]